MDWPWIEYGPPKNFKEFYAKNFNIYALTEKKFWFCFEEQLFICIGILIINNLKTEAASLSEILIFKCKTLMFRTQKNIKDMKVRQSFFFFT